MERFKEAQVALQKWYEMILNTKDDGSEEAQRRRMRKALACYYLGKCFMSLGQKAPGEAYFKTGAEVKESPSERYACMERLADFYNKEERYEETVQICEQLLAADPGYYPAYLHRQEANFKLKNAQQVVDDYHIAVRILPQFYKPYLYAMEVFDIYEQYEDLFRVIEQAKENQVVFSDRMKFIHAKSLRMTAQSANDYSVAAQMLQELLRHRNASTSDLDHVSSIYFEQGLLFRQQKKWEQAMAKIKDAMESDPTNPVYRFTWADILRETEKYKEAIEQYQKVNGDYAWTSAWNYGMGCCYEQLGELHTGMQYFQKVYEKNPEYRDIRFKLGCYYKKRYIQTCKQEDFEQACRYMKELLEQREDDFTLISYGLLLSTGGRYMEAIEQYRKALQYQESWVVYNNISCCYRQLGDFEQSMAYCRRSIDCAKEEDGDALAAYENLMRLYEIRADYPKALQVCQRILYLKPDYVQMQIKQIELYGLMDDYDSGIAECLNLYEQESDPQFLFMLGDLFCMQNDKRQAKKFYDEAVKMDISERYWLYTQTARRVLLYLGDAKSAIRLLDIAERKQQSGGWAATVSQQAEHDFYMARAYYKMGSYKKAAWYAQNSVRLFLNGRNEIDYVNFPGKQAKRLGQIGQCYLMMGNFQKAHAMFDVMGKCHFCDYCNHGACYEFHLCMGMLEQTQGKTRLTEAAKYYEKARSIVPRDLEVRGLLDGFR